MDAVTPPLLTADEQEAVTLAGALAVLLGRIVGTGPNRSRDMAELIPHVHAIQNAVLAQAAARAYPGTYRLMGESLRPTTPEPAPAPPDEGGSGCTCPLICYRHRTLGEGFEHVPKPPT